MELEVNTGRVLGREGLRGGKERFECGKLGWLGRFGDDMDGRGVFRGGGVKRKTRGRSGEKVWEGERG